MESKPGVESNRQVANGCGNSSPDVDSLSHRFGRQSLKELLQRGQVLERTRIVVADAGHGHKMFSEFVGEAGKRVLSVHSQSCSIKLRPERPYAGRIALQYNNTIAVLTIRS